MTGVSGKPLTQKLGIKPGFCIFANRTPTAYRGIVGRLPADVTLVLRLAGGLEMVHLFATEA